MSHQMDATQCENGGAQHTSVTKLSTWKARFMLKTGLELLLDSDPQYDCCSLHSTYGMLNILCGMVVVITAELRGT